MLRTFRNHIESWLLKGVLIMVAITFIFIGLYGYNTLDKTKREYEVVIEVYGKPITYGEFQNTVREQTEFYKKNFKDSPFEELTKNIDFKTMALNNLIRKNLMFHLAKKEGLYVTEQELADSIHNFPVFLTNGRFDERKYKFLLSRNRIAPKDFESAEKSRVLIKKMEILIKDNTKLSKKEILDAYKRDHEEIKVEYILLKSIYFKNKVDISSKELEEFFAKNKDQFREPEKRKIQYVRFAPESFMKTITIDKTTVEEYYLEQKDQYDVPRRIKTRHILIKVSPDASKEEKEKARIKAEKIIKRIKNGKRFLAMAKRYSEGPSAKTGGDLGYFSKGERIEEFEKTAFALEKGKMSEPVLTPFGYFIIKVEDIKEAHIKELKDVKNEIETKLKNKEADFFAEDKANEVWDELYKTGISFEEMAKKYSLDAKTTGYFQKDGEQKELKEIENSKDFVEASFFLELNDISNILRLKDGYYILRLADKKESYIPKLDEIKPEVVTVLKSKKMNEAALKKGKEIIKELKAKKDLKMIARDLRLKIETTGYFSRTNGFPDTPVDLSSLNRIFRLKKDESTLAKSDKGFHIIRLREKKDLDMDKFKKVKDDLAERLLAEKKEMVFKSWLQSKIKTAYQQGAIVEKNKELLN